MLYTFWRFIMVNANFLIFYKNITNWVAQNNTNLFSHSSVDLTCETKIGSKHLKKYNECVQVKNRSVQEGE